MTLLQEKIQDTYNRLNDEGFSSLDEKDKDVINLCLIRMFELHSINNEIVELQQMNTADSNKRIEQDKIEMLHFLNEMNELIHS